MRKKIKIGKHLYGFSLNFWKKRWDEDVKGYSNKVVIRGKEYFLFVLDVDRKDNYEQIKTKLKEVQAEYKIGDILAFETLNGFHFVCLDLLKLGEFVEILFSIPDADRKHITIPILNGTYNWILRFTPKANRPIQFKERIKSDFNRMRLKSFAHSVLIEDIFGVESSGLFENNEKLIIANYKV